MIKVKYLAVLLLVIAIAAQWAVPLSMMSRREIALKRGTIYRFQTAPVDPYDAFRGRYVALSLSTRSVMTTNIFRKSEAIYLKLGTNANGYAIYEAAEFRPSKDGDWIRVSNSYGDHRRNLTGKQGGGATTNEAYTLYIEAPFDRFYMNEKEAPQAEARYNRTSRSPGGNTWVQVRVWRYIPVVEELYIEGTPVRELLEKDKEK